MPSVLANSTAVIWRMSLSSSSLSASRVRLHDLGRRDQVDLSADFAAHPQQITATHIVDYLLFGDADLVRGMMLDATEARICDAVEAICETVRPEPLAVRCDANQLYPRNAVRPGRSGSALNLWGGGGSGSGSGRATAN